MNPHGIEEFREWNDTWALAVIFGLVSVLWTYAFVAELRIPLWPAFIGSATFYAAGTGVDGFRRALASTTVGIGYATLTLAIVDEMLGGGVLALSVIVGLFMFLASLHAFVPPLSFTPGGFFGYATLFSVHAAGGSAVGLVGLPGETLAALVAMAIGVCIGLATDELSAMFGS